MIYFTIAANRPMIWIYLSFITMSLYRENQRLGFIFANFITMSSYRKNQRFGFVFARFIVTRGLLERRFSCKNEKIQL